VVSLGAAYASYRLNTQYAPWAQSHRYRKSVLNRSSEAITSKCTIIGCAGLLSSQTVQLPGCKLGPPSTITHWGAHRAPTANAGNLHTVAHVPQTQIINTFINPTPEKCAYVSPIYVTWPTRLSDEMTSRWCQRVALLAF
jgi:hypothetical protein